MEAGTVPAELEPPELWPGLQGWYDDFLELSTDRQYGMALGPLPAFSIDRHTAGWPDDDADAFRVAMRAMDEVYRAPQDEPEPEPGTNPARDAFRAAFM